jgi:hypothetical protein
MKKAHKTVSVKIDKTLIGDLVELNADGIHIRAIINLDNWFRKVTLLEAKCLNYDWAKAVILKHYINTKGFSR